MALISDGIILSTAVLGDGSGDDYDILVNKPKINGVELIDNKTNTELGIPTKTSELDNDKGFIQETQTENIDINFSDFFKQ